MKIRSIFALAALVVATGCGRADDGGTEDEMGTETQDVVSMKGPETLAKVLNTNHTVKFLGQFLDTRPGGQLPIQDVFAEEGAVFSFPAAKVDDPAIQRIIAMGREADKLGLEIKVAPPEMRGEAPGDNLCQKAAIYVQAKRDADLDPAKDLHDASLSSFTKDHFTPEQAEKSAAADSESDVTVLIALPGDFGQVRAVALSFGIVSRPLNPAASSKTGQFWTLLAADMRTVCMGDAD